MTGENFTQEEWFQRLVEIDQSRTDRLGRAIFQMKLMEHNGHPLLSLVAVRICTESKNFERIDDEQFSIDYENVFLDEYISSIPHLSDAIWGVNGFDGVSFVVTPPLPLTDDWRVLEKEARARHREPHYLSEPEGFLVWVLEESQKLISESKRLSPLNHVGESSIELEQYLREIGSLADDRQRIIGMLEESLSHIPNIFSVSFSIGRRFIRIKMLDTIIANRINASFVGKKREGNPLRALLKERLRYYALREEKTPILRKLIIELGLNETKDGLYVEGFVKGEMLRVKRSTFKDWRKDTAKEIKRSKRKKGV